MPQKDNIIQPWQWEGLNDRERKQKCGNSSVGRAQPCQGWGREFESRFPLQESKSFKDKIKQNPLKHRFRGFFICCQSVSLRLRGAPTRHSPNLEVSLRISTVKIRDTYSEMRGHFDIFSAFYKLFRLAVAYALIKTVR